MAALDLKRRLAAVLVAVSAAGLLGACASEPTEYPQTSNRKLSGNRGNTYPGENTSIFGPGGLNFFGGGDSAAADPGGGGIGVNSYLWRASLDTISFMPLVSADPFGGVIITDWYAPPESRGERFKVNLYILGRELRADGVRAAVFRQQQDVTGNWIDAEIRPDTAIDLEDAILTRARQLRIASVQ
ncbi:MAG: DUF3576 domain-containing protein [Rhodospirillales bacterium]|nr:DUF3576 domain-containing protein [Rhodospirillales bacterium]